MKEIKMSNVYLMKLTSKEGSEIKETMFKIGRSIDPERRSKELSRAYNVEVIDTIELELKECMRLEKTLHSDFYRDRYFPKVKFDGATEIFKNKLCFRHANDFLINQYNAINEDSIKAAYYIDKEARAAEHKAKYWRNKGKGWNKI